jgi:hypothetical protein
MLPDVWSLDTLVRRFQVPASCKRRKVQARCENVVKFTESEGKAPQRKQWWTLVRWDKSTHWSLFQKAFINRKDKPAGKIWEVFMRLDRVMDRFD